MAYKWTPERAHNIGRSHGFDHANFLDGNVAEDDVPDRSDGPIMPDDAWEEYVSGWQEGIDDFKESVDESQYM